MLNARKRNLIETLSIYNFLRRLVLAGSDVRENLK